MLSKLNIVISVVVLLVLGALVVPTVINELDTASNDMADNDSKNSSLLAGDILPPLLIILFIICIGVILLKVII